MQPFVDNFLEWTFAGEICTWLEQATFTGHLHKGHSQVTWRDKTCADRVHNWHALQVRKWWERFQNLVKLKIFLLFLRKLVCVPAIFSPTNWTCWLFADAAEHLGLPQGSPAYSWHLSYLQQQHQLPFVLNMPAPRANHASAGDHISWIYRYTDYVQWFSDSCWRVAHDYVDCVSVKCGCPGFPGPWQKPWEIMGLEMPRWRYVYLQASYCTAASQKTQKGCKTMKLHYLQLHFANVMWSMIQNHCSVTQALATHVPPTSVILNIESRSLAVALKIALCVMWLLVVSLFPKYFRAKRCVVCLEQGRNASNRKWHATGKSRASYTEWFARQKAYTSRMPWSMIGAGTWKTKWLATTNLFATGHLKKPFSPGWLRLKPFWSFHVSCSAVAVALQYAHAFG